MFYVRCYILPFPSATYEEYELYCADTYEYTLRVKRFNARLDDTTSLPAVLQQYGYVHATSTTINTRHDHMKPLLRNRMFLSKIQV